VMEGLNPDPISFTISNTSGGTLNWTASSNTHWLILDSTFGTATSFVSVSVDNNGLSAGTYQGLITVECPDADNSPQYINVTFTINPVTTEIVLTAESGYENTQLDWNAPNDPQLHQYQIYRSADSGSSFDLIGSTPDTVYFDYEDLPIGDRFCYQVVAVRSDLSTISSSNLACTLAGQLEIWIQNISGQPDDEFIVPINIRNATGLAIDASDIWLDYDPQILEMVSISRTILNAGYNWVTSVTSVGDKNRVMISSISACPIIHIRYT